MHIHTYSRTYICTYIRTFTRPSVNTCPAYVYAYAWTNQNVLHNFNNHAQSYGQQAKLKEEKKLNNKLLFLIKLPTSQRLTITWSTDYKLGWFIKLIWDVTEIFYWKVSFVMKV